MPKKANPPRGQAAGEPEIISLLELPYHNPRSTDGAAATFLRADIQTTSLDQQRLAQRLTAYQQKLTQDYQRAIAAAERSDARIADLFADLEEFNSDGGVYALDS